MIQFVKKMTSRVYMINKNKYFFNQKWLKIISTSLVISIFDYCVSTWGNLTKVQYERIDKIFLRLASLVILRRKCKTNEKFDIFEKLNWLSAAERYEIYSINFIYKHVIQETSLTLLYAKYFEKVDDSLRHTRQQMNFVIPRINTEYGKKSFYYQTIKMWNSLPLDIKQTESSASFDVRIRQLLLTRRQSLMIYDELRILD